MLPKFMNIRDGRNYMCGRSLWTWDAHRDLLIHAGLSYGGQFKNTQNYINETKPDGTVVTRFTPLAPYETEPAIEAICESYRQTLAMEVIDPLILIPTFICDFLCIHPFNDGNGRMSRLLTLLLLYQNGYDVVKAYVTGKIGKFTGAEVIADCPSGSRSAVLGALKRLTDEEVIVKCGTGRRTFYVQKDAME